MAKPTEYCKAIILQFRISKKDTKVKNQSINKTLFHDINMEKQPGHHMVRCSFRTSALLWQVMNLLKVQSEGDSENYG